VVWDVCVLGLVVEERDERSLTFAFWLTGLFRVSMFAFPFRQLLLLLGFSDLSTLHVTIETFLFQPSHTYPTGAAAVVASSEAWMG
jgi:hypothetical protein